MLKQQHTISWIFLISGFFLLMSCTNDIKPDDYQAQRTLFLSAIKQTQDAGSLLQQREPSAVDINRAMALLDNAMIDANYTESYFLKWLDAGLYQAFNAYLIKGIENYRLGVELEDREQQAKGLKLLQSWWQYWQLKRPAILEKIKQ